MPEDEAWLNSENFRSLRMQRLSITGIFEALNTLSTINAFCWHCCSVSVFTKDALISPAAFCVSMINKKSVFTFVIISHGTGGWSLVFGLWSLV